MAFRDRGSSRTSLTMPIGSPDAESTRKPSDWERHVSASRASRPALTTTRRGVSSSTTATSSSASASTGAPSSPPTRQNSSSSWVTSARSTVTNGAPRTSRRVKTGGVKWSLSLGRPLIGPLIDGRPSPFPYASASRPPVGNQRRNSGASRIFGRAPIFGGGPTPSMRRCRPDAAALNPLVPTGGFHPWHARSPAGKLSAIVSLFWRVFLFNAAVFVAGTIVLVVGLTAMLLLNLALVRISFSPLERLTNLMRHVDLLAPGQRLDASGPTEVRELGRVFNEMLERLEDERRESTRRALAAQESERERVAHELHDEIGQMLTAVVLQLNDLAARVAPELREEVLRAQEAARR